jgi:hypothetical protein
MSRAPLCPHCGSPAHDAFREFVVSIAEIQTDDELGGDMPGDDAASELSSWIEHARALLCVEQKEAAW